MADRTLTVKIIGDASSLERAFAGGTKAAGRFSVGIGTILKSAIVFDVFNKAVEGLSRTLHTGIGEFSENARVAAQTAAAIRSTGGVAAVTARQVDTLGLKLSNLSGIDDEVVRQGENVLLSFTDIRNEAGKGNDVFDQATKAVVDFAARTGKDVPQAAVILGRALADPASRLASLSRAGVVFTKSQIDSIKTLEKTKGLLAAQKVVLGELEKRFGGAAAAAGKTLPGQLNVLRDRFKDLAGTVVGVFAPSFAKAVAATTGFVRRISEAQGIHAKLSIVWEGIQQAGASLVDTVRHVIGSIDWNAIGADITRFLSRVDFAAAGRALGEKALSVFKSIADAIGRVNWQAVGQTIVVGLGRGIQFVVAALPGLLEGIGRVIASVLEAMGGLLLGAGRTLGSAILKGITAGLSAAGQALERLALTIALKIVEPFSHLPKWLGGGPFQKMKAEFQATLDGMVGASQTAAEKIAVFMGGAADAIGQAAKQLGLAVTTKGAGSINRSAGFAPDTVVGAPTFTPLPSQAGAAAIEKGFTLPLRLQIEQAKADASGSQRAVLQAARDIASFLRSVIPSLHGQKLRDAYSLLASANSTIADAAKAAADAAKAAADKLKQFSVPLSLQVAQAKLEALGKPFDDILKKIRSVAQQALKSGRLGLQGQLDAWNTIKDVNDQLRNEFQQTRFTKANTASLVRGLGLDAATLKALRARLSQLGPGGTVPRQGFTGAFGFAVPITGGDTVVHTTVNLDGKKVAENTTRHQQIRRRRNPVTKSGPNRGR